LSQLGIELWRNREEGKERMLLLNEEQEAKINSEVWVRNVSLMGLKDASWSCPLAKEVRPIFAFEWERKGGKMKQH